MNMDEILKAHGIGASGLKKNMKVPTLRMRPAQSYHTVAQTSQNSFPTGPVLVTDKTNKRFYAAHDQYVSCGPLPGSATTPVTASWYSGSTSIYCRAIAIHPVTGNILVGGTGKLFEFNKSLQLLNTYPYPAAHSSRDCYSIEFDVVNNQLYLGLYQNMITLNLTTFAFISDIVMAGHYIRRLKKYGGNFFTVTGNYIVEKRDAAGTLLWSKNGHDFYVHTDGMVYVGYSDKTYKYDQSGAQLTTLTNPLTQAIWIVGWASKSKLVQVLLKGTTGTNPVWMASLDPITLTLVHAYVGTNNATGGWTSGTPRAWTDEDMGYNIYNMDSTLITSITDFTVA